MRLSLRSAILLSVAICGGPALADGVGSSGVPSVNGKYGPVTLGPGDVGSLPCAGTCAQWTSFLPQLTALVPSASTIDIETSITDAPSGADYLELRSGTIRAGGPLATFIQARYSLSSGQMTALLAAAGATTSSLATFAAAAADLSNVVPATGRAALGVRGLGLLDVLDTAQRTATGSTTPRTAAAAAADVLLGFDNGMKCDGVTDDGPALQILVNRISASTSSDIYLPYGVCLINTAVSVSLATVHLIGQGWGEAAAGLTGGTMLSTSNPAITPITFSNYHNTAGSSVEHVGLSQSQPAPAVGWAPTVYPPFIADNGSPGIHIRDVYGFGVYDGFNLFNAGRYEVSGIYGQFFHSVLTADNGHDLAHIFHWHIWPFWTDSLGTSGAALDAVMAWQEANADTIVLGRQDGATIRDVFTFMTNGGVTFKNLSGSGVASNIMIDELQCDSDVHCLKNVGQVGASIYLGRMNSFGQSGVSSGTAYPGANAIYSDVNSSWNIAGGDIKQGYADTSVIEADSLTGTSTMYFHSLQTYSMIGATGSSVLKLARTNAGINPHLVTVDEPLNIALSSGSYLAGVNWSTTNAQVRIPGLDYQIIENTTASQFNGNSYAIENARPKVFIEADDGNAIASMSLVLPKYPYDGMEATVTSYVAITALSVSDPNGRPIVGSPTTLAAGATVRFKWTNTGTSIVWLRQ